LLGHFYASKKVLAAANWLVVSIQPGRNYDGGATSTEVFKLVLTSDWLGLARPADH
jgi:hypothetical protein